MAQRGKVRGETEMSSEKVKDVIRKVQALRELTAMTGTITKRSQGLLLQSLTPEELTLAAELLTSSKDGQTNATHNPTK
jgi:hypothetical protein